MLTMLDLFAGIGGASVAGDRLGIRTTRFVEIDPDARTVLRSHWPDTPIAEDIRDYHARRGEFDIIWSSFPCTGTSIAGKRDGLHHPDSALWREGIRILIECRPRFFVVEQPTGVIDRGLRAILGGIRMAGYAHESAIVSASECGAGHDRSRLFIVSYPDHQQERYQRAGWEEQIGGMVQRARADSRWLSVKRSGDGGDRRLSVQLVRGALGRELRPEEYSVPTYTPGRIRARYLAGRVVTPAQASIPLQRVLYLHDLG
jgi:DNA (cytosine-5)-methyltransferase 1